MEANHIHIFLLIALFTIISCSHDNENNNVLNISAAASMTDILEELNKDFEKEYNCTIVTHYAASSIIARQLEYGLHCDLFISADQDWVNYLVERSLLSPEDIYPLLKNRLVIAVKNGRALKISGLNSLKSHEIKNIAIGDYSNVPAGRYAKTALENAGLWEDLIQKIIPAVDVRAARALVETGAADCAIIYASDIYRSSNAAAAYSLNDSENPAITYYAATMNKTGRALSLKYLNYLKTKAVPVIEKHGFNIIQL